MRTSHIKSLWYIFSRLTEIHWGTFIVDVNPTAERHKALPLKKQAQKQKRKASTMSAGAEYEQYGAGESDPIDSEDSYLSEDEDQWMEPTNPLMDRVQNALKAQLEKADAAVSLELQTKDEAVSRVKKQREQIGVELYGYQQQLAKLQLNLEKTHDRFNQLRELRESAEENLHLASEIVEKKAQEREELQFQRTEAQKELDRLNYSLKQIEDFNKELQSDILVTRRAAYGTEENIQAVEKEKREQDLLIDELDERIHKATEELKVYEAQIDAQKTSSAGAQEMLQEAMVEMEAINKEKKEYIAKWKSSLIGIARRDAALEEAEAAIRQHQENIQLTKAEITGYRDAVRKEQEKNEKLSSILGRVQSETRFLEGQIETLLENRKALNAQYEVLKTSLEKIDVELASTKVEQRKIESVVNNFVHRREAIVQKKKALELEILEHAGEQVTIEKGAQNVFKLTKKIAEQIHEKELQISEVENELARIRVDSLNTKAHIKELEETHKEFESELKEKDKLIEKYEQEIRKRHDEVEKKQLYIVRLNKKFESLTANKEDAPETGPLEATINHLTKEINHKEKESNEMQRQWIKCQTELVGLMSQMEEKQEKVQELNSKETIMKQKRLRVERNYQEQVEEVKGIEKSIVHMQVRFSKLNELIAQHKKLKEELSNENFTIQEDFKEKLKELEERSISMDTQVVELKAEKERIFTEIIEYERQILLWEKKIQLEKETQAALDPTHGQAELKGMKKEIHRMELRLNQLRRHQEAMISEMERTISKQESIKLSHTSSKTREHLTQATLKKKVMTLKQTLKQNIGEVKRVDGDVQRQEEENAVLLKRLEVLQKEYEDMQDRKYELQRRVEEEALRKRVNLEKIIAIQKRTQKLSELGERDSFRTEKEKLVERLSKHENTANQLHDALQQLSQQNPKYSHVFNELMLLTT